MSIIADIFTSDTLHKSRLLNVEEKPFKRITKRLLGASALTSTPPILPPTPPPDASAADEEGAAREKIKQNQLEERRQWREDVQLDFAAFESSIVRIQFLLTSNIQERGRYAAEKVKIENTAQAVRDNTADLRVQLSQVQDTLALRKEYDEMAEKITSNPRLRPRDDQQQAIERLHNEIAELQRESQEYAQTWAERREQFGKIIEEGMQLRRLIRDEKEEVERREGMEGQEDGDEDHKRESSGLETPRPGSAGGATPLHGTGKGTDAEGSSGLVVEKGEAEGTSPLREMQTATEQDGNETSQEQQDEEMAEDGELAAEPENTTAAPVEGLGRVDTPSAEERMDVT